MTFKTKIEIFLVTHRNLLYSSIPVIFYLFNLSFIDLDIGWITSCSGNDACSEAIQKALEDAKEQFDARGVVQRRTADTMFEGKSIHHGSGSIERGDKVYVGQVVETLDKDGSTITRMSSCMSAKKPK